MCQATTCQSCPKFKKAFASLSTTQQTLLNLRWTSDNAEAITTTLYGMTPEQADKKINAAINQLRLMLPCMRKHGIRQQVVEAIETLPERQQLIISLRAYEGLNNVEIAKVLGASVEETVLEWNDAMNTLRSTLPKEVMQKIMNRNSVTCEHGTIVPIK